MKEIVFLLLSLALSLQPLFGQRLYGEVLDAVVEEGVGYDRLVAHHEAGRQSALGTSVLPSPEVEYGHYWGDPAAIGGRWDLSVTQSFPFPTTWLRQSKARQMAAVAADLDFDVRRAAYLYNVQQLCSDIVFYNAMVVLYGRCADNAGGVSSLYARRLATGDCGVIEYNRAQLVKMEADERLAKAAAEREVLLSRLRLLSPNVTAFDCDTFAAVVLPVDFDAWYADVRTSSPSLAAARQQSLLSEQEWKVARSQWLPSLSVGYASETVTGEAFRGVTVGATLPLWNNARRVEAARAESVACKADEEWAERETKAHYRTLLMKARSLQERVAAMSLALRRYDSSEKMLKALDMGEVSLEQYLLAMDAYNDAATALLEARHELEALCLQLYAAFL